MDKIIEQEKEIEIANDEILEPNKIHVITEENLPIILRQDGSYQITKNGLPYGVEKDSELHREIAKYLEENPTNYEYEKPLFVSDEKKKEYEIINLKHELELLDVKIPRSTEDLYVALNIKPHNNVEIIINQKKELRAKLNDLSK